MSEISEECNSPLEIDVKLEVSAEDTIDEENQGFSPNKDENVEDDTMKELDSDGKEDENGDDNSKKIKEIENEHFSKTKPNEFSSENFKIRIRGLPKRYPFSKLKSTLSHTLDLKIHRIRCGTRDRSRCFVSFKDEESRQNALAALKDYEWEGYKLNAEIADPAQDPMMLAKIDCLKLPERSLEDLPWNEQIEKAVIPLASLPYEEQLASKSKALFGTLRKFGSEMAKMNPELSKFFIWHKIRRKGGICEIDEIVKSPILEGYRNKCEFTIGKSSECTTPVVGFRLASYSKGCVEVRSINHLRHINPKMKQVAKLMEAFLKDSKYETFDPFSHKGVWRQLCVRTTFIGDVMLIPQIHPQEMDTEEIDQIKEDLKNFFTVGEGADAGVTSLFFQQVGQLESGKEIETELLFGKEFIEETILGKTFKASPDAFLQVNTPACEMLYKKVMELSEIDPTSVLLDICCGVGTIGISLAEGAYKVIGVETNENAVLNARENAERNGIENAVFYHGKAEDYMESMLSKSQRNNCIAVLDPPRAGLANSVINALRRCDYLDKIVYISCNLPGALSNFQALCKPRSKSCKGTYFVPTRACAVDLFPDTSHYECIVVFERYDECKWDRIMAGNPRPKDQEYYSRVPVITKEEETEIAKRRRRSEEKRRARKRTFAEINQRKREMRRERGRERDFYNRRRSGGGNMNFGSGYDEGYRAALEDLRRNGPDDFNFRFGRGEPYRNQGPSPFNLPRGKRDNIPPLLPDLPSRSSNGGNQWTRGGMGNMNQPGPGCYPSNCGNNGPPQNFNNQWNNQMSNSPNWDMNNQNSCNPPNNWMMNSGPGNQGDSWGPNNQSQQGGPWGNNQSQQGGSWVGNNQSQQGGSWVGNNQSPQGGSWGGNNQSSQGGSWVGNNQSQQGGSWGSNNQSQQGSSWGSNNHLQQGGSWSTNNQAQQGGSWVSGVNNQASNSNWNSGSGNSGSWMIGNSGPNWSNTSSFEQSSNKKFKTPN